MSTTRRALLRAALVGSAALALPPFAAQAQTLPAPETGPFKLPPLPYAFDALEPFIDAQTMQIHHDRHHAAYVANLNKAFAEHRELKAPANVDALVLGLLLPNYSLPPNYKKIDDALFATLRNNGGGHANHSLFWPSMKKGGGGQPKAELARAIDKQFGSFDAFKAKMTDAAIRQFGSGWAWLSVEPLALRGRLLTLEALPNQDSPLMYGRTPLLGVDVWEHAYYLKYQNKRADYVAAWWNTVDWDAVSERYAHSPIG